MVARVSSQIAALAALLLLYRRVLNVDLPWLGNVVRAKRPKRLPVVLSRQEVRRILSELEGQYLLIASPSVWKWAAADGGHAPSL